VEKILIIQDSPSANAMLKLGSSQGGSLWRQLKRVRKVLKKAKAGQYQLIFVGLQPPGNEWRPGMPGT